MDEIVPRENWSRLGSWLRAASPAATVAALLIASSPAPGQAAPTYDVNIGRGVGEPGCADHTSQNGSTPLSISAACSSGLGFANATAAATPGSAAISTEALHYPLTPFDDAIRAHARYETSVIFRGPAASLVTSLNLNLNSDLGKNYHSAYTEMSALVMFNGVNFGLQRYLYHVQPEYCASGFVGGAGCASGSSTLTTGNVSVPIDVPVPISLQVRGLSSADGGSFSAQTAFALFELSFRQGGGLFNLPAGFTVNAADSFIENNSFDLPGEVPEPAMVALLGLGLSGVALARRRRVR